MGTLTNYSIAGGVPVDVFPVKDKTGAAVAGRTVRAYREDTGALIGSATTTEELSEQVGDEHLSSVVLAMHMDGSNDSTTFTDETGKTVTPYGDAKISTAQSKFGGASGYFDGSGDYLTVPDSPDFDLPGDFTIEFFAFTSSTAAYSTIFSTTTNGSYTNGYGVEVSGTRGFTFIGTGAGIILSASHNPNNSTWRHYAVTRSGSTVRLFIDGVLSNSGTYATSLTGVAAYVACAYSGTYPFTGYIDDLRITKGVARYTENFTPPAAAFFGANLPPTPLGGYKIDTGAHSGPCALVFSGEPDRNALVLSGVTPV
jgi:hypothetical protein